MAHPDFILWMIGFPIGWQISSWINSNIGGQAEEYSDAVNQAYAVIVIALWLGVGWALW